MFTGCGQPYYSIFERVAEAACEFLAPEDFEDCTNDRDVPRGLANHLYAVAPLRVSEEENKGITDLPAFILAKYSDARTESLVQKTLENVFSRAKVQELLGDAIKNLTMRQAASIFKEFALMSHFLKQLCQQHFQPRFGATVDKFLQLTNSRRTIPQNRVLDRIAVEDILAKLLQ